MIDLLLHGYKKCFIAFILSEYAEMRVKARLIFDQRTEFQRFFIISAKMYFEKLVEQIDDNRQVCFSGMYYESFPFH